MSPCPPQQARNRPGPPPAPELGEMELTWQEIMSITELQGLDTAPETPYEAALYGAQPPAPDFGPCGLLPAGPPPSCGQHPFPYARHYPAGPEPGPYPYDVFGGLPAPGPPPPKPLTLSGLLSEPLPDPVTLAEMVLPSATPALLAPHKCPEDPESDSGLSLNYSDAESLDPEAGAGEVGRPEYAELFPPALPPPPAWASPPGPARPKPPGRGEAGCRDQRRALAMKIPFPTDKIVNLPVDDFNELLGRYPLSESQLALVRDIRRRGKNKVAAQNCRKRKLETLVQLERELAELTTRRERLLRARGEAGRTLGLLRQQLGDLYRDVFARLQDQEGNGYSPDEYVLQQAADGTVFLAPRGGTPDQVD
ncbi:transcription factor NF-E2 45 kDa subunit [Tachyglossus aculeatus]|uniref:transcription factor NF-E2 45 kDa subunit n=1 Tax=Tachyglossus aculeatus TaxID=9261 RepID=UPI0018F5D32B|nr:transcription factor NF-E2 45 kDa subunit [Tachyglossus aculeatus]